MQNITRDPTEPLPSPAQHGESRKKMHLSIYSSHWLAFTPWRVCTPILLGGIILLLWETAKEISNRMHHVAHVGLEVREEPEPLWLHLGCMHAGTIKTPQPSCNEHSGDPVKPDPHPCLLGDQKVEVVALQFCAEGESRDRSYINWDCYSTWLYFLDHSFFFFF